MKRKSLRKQSLQPLPKLKREVEALARQVVRTRDDKCQAKGVDGHGCWGYTQASHVYPKGTYSHMRFDIENMIGMCTHHHLYWWHKNPLEAGRWVKEYLGGEKLEELKQKSRRMIQWRRPELEELKIELKEKLNEIEEIQISG